VAASQINVNTASPVLLVALVRGLDMRAAEGIAEARRSNPFRDVNMFKDGLPRQLVTAQSPPVDRMSAKSDYFLVTLDTSIGRHERRSEALMQRSAGSTNVVWHRPRPLTGSDEVDEPK